MSRAVHRLSTTGLKSRPPGYHSDGGNLYFRVTDSGTRGWIFRFALNGRTRDAGLGPFPEIGLSEARTKAFEYRRLVVAGIDPIEQRNGARAAARVEAARTITFDDCRTAYIASHEASWKNAKHRQQWTNTLQTYASPVFGKLPVSAVDTGLVMRAIEPIWSTKPETAGRLRGRIEALLDWAKVRGYREGENPARWRGHLDHLLPAKSKVQKVEHHPALPYADIGAFIPELQQQSGMAAKALEFLILTATRTSETLEAAWGEIDLPGATWTIPAARMKGGRDHRVPLSVRALAVLADMHEIRHSDYVFPGMRRGQPLSEMAMLMLLRRMDRDDITAHGFRSTFRDWAAECTSFPPELAEMALAHAVGNKVEAAYRRGDMFDKRRKLMDAWAEFCSKPAAARS
jgi:integrase